MSKGISGSTLKIVAVTSMLIDHIGAVFLTPLLLENEIYSVADISPSYIMELMDRGDAGWVYLAYQIMRRLIGRIAFPIFCFLLVEGFERTRSRGKYALRLFLFALVSELPYDMVFSYTGGRPEFTDQNIFFTLLFGVFALAGIAEAEKKLENVWMRFGGIALAVFLAAFFAEKLCFDYGAKGIIAIALLYLFRRDKGEQILAGCVAFVGKLPALLAFIPIAFYNGKRGFQMKYFFYIFYPAHLLVLYFIRRKWMGF